MTDSQLCTVRDCGTPAPTAICRDHLRQLEHDLAHLPEAFDELAITIGRRSRVGGGKRGKGDAVPAPINLHALAERDQVAADLRELIGLVSGIDLDITEGHDCRRPWTRDHHAAHTIAAAGPQGVARLLLAQLPAIGSHIDAAPIATRVGRIRSKLTRLVDQPEQRLYAGPCGARGVFAHHDDTTDTLTFVDGWCQAQLYARPGKDTIVCDGHGQDANAGCGAEHSLTNRQKWLIDAIEDHLAPLQVILDALPGLIGRDVDKATVRQWRARHRLLPHGLDRNGVELYRGGDVVALVRDQAIRTGPKRKGRTDGRMSA